jgi:hypothetical protein
MDYSDQLPRILGGFGVLLLALWLAGWTFGDMTWKQTLAMLLMFIAGEMMTIKRPPPQNGGSS